MLAGRKGGQVLKRRAIPRLALRPTTDMTPTKVLLPRVAVPIRSLPCSTEVVASTAPSLTMAPLPMETRSGASICGRAR
jgi:hypothetical protein